MAEHDEQRDTQRPTELPGAELSGAELSGAERSAAEFADTERADIAPADATDEHDGLVSRVALIEQRPLDERAEAFTRLYDELRIALDRADSPGDR